MDITSSKQRISQLEFQNRRLSETVEVQKSELVKKEKTLETQIQRWSDAETSILAIQRSWKQLSEDLIYLASKQGIEVRPHQPNEKVSVFLDPFVRALLAPSSSSELDKEAVEAVKTMEDFSEEVELEIKAESGQLHGLLAQILDQSKDRPLEASQDSKTELEESCNQVRGINRTLVEKSRLLEDKITKQDSELTEFRNQLAELQIQLQNAQRKIAGYRQNERKQQQESSKLEASIQSDSRKLASDTQLSTGTDSGSKVNEIKYKWLEQQIETKTRELEKEKSDHQKTQLELRLMDNQLKDQTRIMTSGVYTSLLAQKDQLHGEVEKKNREIDKLQYSIQCKEQELSRRRTSDPESRQTTLDSLQDAHKKSKDLRNQLIEKERALQDRGGSGVIGSHQDSSFLELKKLVKTSQEEVQRLKRRLKDKEDSSALEKAREDSMELNKRLRSSEDELDRLRQSLKESEEARIQQSNREKELYKSKQDLKVFVDTLATVDIVDKQYKELEAKSRERNLMRENQNLKRKLADLDRPEHAELVKKAESYQRRMHRLSNEREEARVEKHQLEKTLKHHKEDLDQLKQLRTALEEELEETGAAYEDIQSQNLKLVNTIKDKETEISDLKNQKSKLTHKTGALNLELENLQEEVNLNKAVWSELEKIKDEFQSKINDLQTGIQRLEKELETKQSEIEDLHQELVKNEANQDQLQVELEASHRTIDQKSKALEHETELRLNERSKRQKIEAESKMIEAFKEKIRSGSATTTDFDGSKEIALLNDEIEAMRRCLNCSVCGTRRKSTILVKCMHTFCKQCIDDCVEKRRRRCPGCGTPFGKDDVKPFFLS